MSVTENIVLGAEQQAASSLALSYPERRFMFVSDAPVIDGWDLANVGMRYSTPEQAIRDFPRAEAVPLCPRWVENPAETSLSKSLARIADALQGIVAPVHASPFGKAKFIVKGDHWHRPDHAITGTASQLGDIIDRHGCGIVYQELLSCESTFAAIGRRAPSGSVAIGLFRVFAERHFRIDFVQAGESIEDSDLLQKSHDVLDALDWDGWFTLNWLACGGETRLSSFRPVPKGMFRCFRLGGIDLLRIPSRNIGLRAGLRFVAEPHYSEFQWLNAC